jgi:hypothetical protein
MDWEKLMEMLSKLIETKKAQGSMLLERQYKIVDELNDLVVEFFTIWKPWNHAFDPQPVMLRTPAVRRSFCDRLARIEGKANVIIGEALFNRRVTEEEVDRIAKFRMAIQDLRGRIHKNVRMNWNDPHCDYYMALKRGFVTLVGVILGRPYDSAVEQYQEIMAQKWENKVAEPYTSKPPFVLSVLKRMKNSIVQFWHRWISPEK